MKYIELGNLLEYEQPTKYIVKDTKYDNKYKTPVLTAGQSFILGYTNEEENIFEKEKLPVILFDDFTTSTQFVDFQFKVKSSAMKILKAKNDINIKYVFYAMKMIKFDNQLHKRYWISQYSNIKIPVPNIKEQEKIVEELDKLKNAINLKEKNQELFDKLVISIFNEMFGNPVINDRKWKIELLGNLGNFKNGMNFKRNDKGYQIKCLGVGNFNNENIINNVELLDTINLNEKPSKEYLLNNKDIIFVRSNGSKELVGRSILIDCSIEELTYSGFCIRYRNNNDKLNVKFLIELFHNKEFFEYLKKDSRGANINNINQQMLSDLIIILPPIELQNKFVNLVSEIYKKKEQLKKDIEDLKKLQENLMNKYFN